VTTISILTEKSDQDEITDAYNHKGALCLTVREVKVSKLGRERYVRGQERALGAITAFGNKTCESFGSHRIIFVLILLCYNHP
jgi:hypothetical protein